MHVETCSFGSNDVAYVVTGMPGHSFMVIPHGAHLVGVHVPDRNGAAANVVLGFTDTESYRTHAERYFGSTIGRFANRIGDARFELDGVVYRLEANEGPNQLHGGAAGFHTKQWQVEPVIEPDTAGLRLTCVSPAGECGFPGTVAATTTYAWERTSLVITHEATTDAPTVLSMTNHAYWSLGGPLARHRLQVAAEAVLDVDADHIPTGALCPVAGTGLDLTSPRELGPAIAATGGIDRCFVLDPAGTPADVIATLACPTTGRRIDVVTDQPALVVYTANDAGPFPDHSAVCLEAHGFPDAPNHATFPSAVLRPGEQYRSRTEYRFSVE